MFLYFFIAFCVYHVLYQFYWKFVVSPDFTGKTVLITGASSGIGEALVHKFACYNAKKIIISARRLDQLVRVKKECKL